MLTPPWIHSTILLDNIYNRDGENKNLVLEAYILSVRTWAPSQKTSILVGVAQYIPKTILICLAISPRTKNLGLLHVNSTIFTPKDQMFYRDTTSSSRGWRHTLPEAQIAACYSYSPRGR